MKNYYISEGNMYIIDEEIYELFEDQRIIPTRSELLKVKKLIKNINKDIFSSPKLNEIAKKNNELYKIDALPDILKRMEKFIGEEYIDSFYKNLETVKFEFDEPTEYIESEDYHEFGYHDSLTNTIHIYDDSVDCLRTFANNNDLDFNLVFNIALAHELFHLASFKNLITESGFLYKGLCEINCTNKYASHSEIINYGKAKAFNEGITQLFACGIYVEELGNVNFHKFNNTYRVESSVIYQIANMIERKEIKNSYFNNLGMGYIKYKLLEIDKNRQLYNELSSHMGRLTNYDLSESIRNSSIIKIQNILLQYETKYIDMIDNIDEKKSFIDSINYFFVGFWKDMDNMDLSDEAKALIQENLNMFNSLKEKQKTYKK